MMLHTMLTSLWITLAAVVAMFLWWSHRAELASADRASRLHEALWSLSTGGSARRTELTKEQIEVLRALSSGQVRAELLRWLEHLGVPLQDREDVAQRTLLEATRSIATFDRTKGTPRGWLNAIATNIAGKHRDLAYRRHEVLEEDPAGEMLDASPMADEGLETEERRRALHSALDQVSPDERAILVAHDLEGEEMRSIAERLGVPLSTAYKWRARGIHALTKALRPARG